MTGTTASSNREFAIQQHCWDWNDGIYIWRSEDLKSWEPLGLVWSFEKDATWQKEPKVHIGEERYGQYSVNGDPLDNKFRALWAPELHYIKSQRNWFIVACLNQSAKGSGSFILKSTTGRPGGPYINIEGNQSEPIFDGIDGSLFENTDGTVYFIGLNHYIAKMKPDMSGFAEELRIINERKYDPEPYIEGASIIKHDGKYHLIQAIWAHLMPDGRETYAVPNKTETCYSYDCIIATADDIYGPYSERYTAVTGGGHNIIFRDKDDLWWATLFYNPRGSQAREFDQTCRPALIPMKYENVKFLPDPTRCENRIDIENKVGILMSDSPYCH